MLKIINPNPSSTGELGSDDIDLRFTNTLDARFLDDYLKTLYISPRPDGCVLMCMGLSHGLKIFMDAVFRKEIYRQCEILALQQMRKNGQKQC